MLYQTCQQLGSLQVFVVGSCGLLGALRDDPGDVIPGWGALERPRGRERGGRANLPDVLASWSGRNGQSAAQEASRNGVAAREKRYADCSGGQVRQKRWKT